MAHITEILIDGLLGREDPIYIKLNRGVNILFGENGSGKTTLLKVLDAALSMDGEAMLRLPVTRATIGIYSITEGRVLKHVWDREAILSKNKKSSRQLELTPQDLYSRELLEIREGRYLIDRINHNVDWKLSPQQSKSHRKATRWAHTFLQTTRLYFGDKAMGRSTAGRTELSEKELDQAFSESINRAWLQFYSQTLDKVRHIQESGLRTVLRHVLAPSKDLVANNETDPKLVFQRVSKFLDRQPESNKINIGTEARFIKRYETEPDLRRIVDNLNNVESEIERAMIPIDSFLETISSLFSRGKSLKLSEYELKILLADGRDLHIAELSSGEKHLIKILLTTMTAGPNSVLIDEPELSMHIDWQRVLVKTILSLNPHSQLIIASHSPEIMAEIEDECIFKL